jgi:hypothetical protein
MDVSDLRKRILRALDEARRDAATRREAIDTATKEYEALLADVVVPLLRQSASVLTAAGQPFVVNTPAGSARLASATSPETFLEVEFDASGERPAVLGRVSVTRRRQGVIIEEQPIGRGKPVGELADEDVAAFIVAAVPRLVGRP